MSRHLVSMLLAAAVLGPAVAAAQPAPAASGGEQEPYGAGEAEAESAPPVPPPAAAADAASEPADAAPPAAAAPPADAAPPAAQPADRAGAAARLAWYDAQRRNDLPEESEEEEPDAGYHRHDGFFLRLGFGLGMGGLLDRREPEDARLEISEDWDSSWLGHQSVSIGGCLVDNLAVYVDLRGYADFSLPDSNDAQRATGFVGLGVSYYFMPANVSLSGSFGPATTVLTTWADSYRDRRYDYDYDWRRDSEIWSGVGGSLSLGKEWWVHDNWGVGMEAGLLYTYAAGWQDQTVWTQLHSMAVTLALSATFN